MVDLELSTCLIGLEGSKWGKAGEKNGGVKIGYKTKVAYHSAYLIIVQIDLGMNILRFLSRVQEHLRELDAVVEVVGASPPLPSGSELRSGHRAGFPHFVGFGVATAVEEESRATASRYGYGHPRGGDGVGESCFLIPYKIHDMDNFYICRISHVVYFECLQ